MINHIHFKKDSAGPERFAVTIDVKSMQEITLLQSQLLSEHKEYPELLQIKERLECTIKENRDTQKSTKAKLDKMDNDYTEKNHKIDVITYEALEDYLDELLSLIHI